MSTQDKILNTQGKILNTQEHIERKRANGCQNPH